MAESVQWHTEVFSGEMHELERLGFGSGEISFMMKKRKELHYKTNGPYKSLKDIKDCIRYEKFYLKKITLRRNKLKINDGRQNLEHKIVKRIKSFYEFGLHRYPEDYSLAISFFKFCKQHKYFEVASLHIKTMTEVFSHIPEVWRMAAEWKMKTDKKEAQRTLNKGLQIHRSSTDLCSDAINMILAQADIDRKTNDKFDPQPSCKDLEVYIEHIFHHISDCDYLISVLKQLTPHSFTRKIQDLIIDKLKDKYPHEPLVYQAIAEQEMDGHHYKFPEGQKSSFKFCLSRCFEVYEQGLKRVPEENQADLWRYYLDAIINAHKRKPRVATSLKLNTFKDVLKRAGEVIRLEEKHYAAMVELYDDNIDGIKDVLDKATSKLPDSVTLWELTIKYAIMTDNQEEVHKAFKRAIYALNDKAATIWLTIVHYHILRSSNKVLSIFSDGIKQPEPVSRMLKPEYIQWVSLTKGMPETRKVYSELAELKPYCKELHYMMAQLESMELSGFGQDYNEWGKCLKLACNQFGSEDVDVWINYIKFYMYEQRNFDSKERIRQIYDEACNTLPELLCMEFKEKFRNLEEMP